MTGEPALSAPVTRPADGVRIAAIADLHMRPAVAGRFRPYFAGLAGEADLLLLAGDLTNGGTAEDADLLRDELTDLPVPAVAVLGNHDHDEGLGDQLAGMLTSVGITVLDGAVGYWQLRGVRVGVAGIMGGGGGFPGADRAGYQLDDEQKARLRRGPVDAVRLGKLLEQLDSEVRIALMHFAPITETLAGERIEIYPGLGCHELGVAVDAAGVDLVVHGHAHAGAERGRTTGGYPVRNVAYPVLGRPYAVYRLDDGQVHDIR
jgi:Icc-related predicted phosphoesterase